MFDLSKLKPLFQPFKGIRKVDDRDPALETAAQALATQRGVPLKVVEAEGQQHVCYLNSCNEERICQYPKSCVLKERGG